MDSLDVTFKISFLTKAELTNVTLVLLEIFMNTFNVFSYLCLFESGIITQITFKDLLVFMHHFNMPLSIETLLRWDFHGDCCDFWDLSRFSRFVETFWDLLRYLDSIEVLHHQKSWQIEKYRSRNMIKLTNSRSRLRQTFKVFQKCHVSTDFSIWIETFETERWRRD